jgi:hypothetical protein
VLAALRIFGPARAAASGAAPGANPPLVDAVTPPATSTAITLVTTPAAAEAPIARVWLRDREAPPPSRPTPEDHAQRLLVWLKENRYAGKPVLAKDLKHVYPTMAEELGWQPYGWQPVATELRKLTGPKKYRRFEGRQRAIYCVPP